MCSTWLFVKVVQTGWVESVCTSVDGQAAQTLCTPSAPGDKLNGKGALDARATLRRPPASAGSRRTLQPCSSACPVFQNTVRPGSGFHSGNATQRRPTGLKLAASADTTNQVPNAAKGKEYHCLCRCSMMQLKFALGLDAFGLTFWLGLFV